MLYFLSTLLLFHTTTAKTTMQAVQVREPGPPENMYISRNTPVPELDSPDHLLIRVVATAVNRADTLQRKGAYAPPEGASQIIGLEASGIVKVVGDNVNNFRVGDRVMALLGGGGYAEYVAVHQYHVMAVPAELDLARAAAIPEVWLTAYQLLFFVGQVQPGNTVLVHAAGSGVGTAAIQLAKQVESCTVIATAGTEQKLNRAKELGADLTINYKTHDFSQAVNDFTGGVDIILDPVGASYWEKNLASLKTDGKWVLYGLMGGASVNGNILGGILKKRISILPTTLRSRSLEYKRQLVEHFWTRDTQDKFVKGVYIPIIDSITSLSEVVHAHQRMEANLNAGKIVMEVSKGEDAKQEL